MLDLVSKLSKDRIRNVLGGLCNEIYAYALGTDELDDLFDLFHESLVDILEEKVRFIKKEYHSRLIGISDLRKSLEEFREHPEKEGGIQGGIVDKLACIQDVNHALSFSARHKEIRYVKGGFRKEILRALRLHGNDVPYDGGCRLLGDVSIS